MRITRVVFIKKKKIDYIDRRNRDLNFSSISCPSIREINVKKNPRVSLQLKKKKRKKSRLLFSGRSKSKVRSLVPREHEHAHTHTHIYIYLWMDHFWQVGRKEGCSQGNPVRVSESEFESKSDRSAAFYYGYHNQ